MNNLFFIVFMVFVVVMLTLDLTVFHRKDHVVKAKEAALQTGMWVMLAMGFAVLLYVHAEWVHGLSVDSFASEAELRAYRHETAMQFLSGYFLEESLSIDNIFVMIMIFVSFGIKKEYYHRVLFWGIFGAIVMRFIFIFALGALVTKFAWVLALFGADSEWSEDVSPAEQRGCGHGQPPGGEVRFEAPAGDKGELRTRLLPQGRAWPTADHSAVSGATGDRVFGHHLCCRFDTGCVFGNDRPDDSVHL